VHATVAGGFDADVAWLAIVTVQTNRPRMDGGAEAAFCGLNPARSD
jgi:hypothetical protein